MNIPVQNVYYLLLYAWKHSGEEEERFVEDLDSTRLQDLFAHVLAEAVARLLSRGLDREYVVIDEPVAGVRGKLDISATLKQGLLANVRTYCRFDDLQYDILQNRIIKATLRSLLSVDLDTNVRSRIRRLYSKLDAVTDSQITTRDFRRVRLHRNNRPYGFALSVCRLIHDNLMISNATGRSVFRDFRRDERQMAWLFEAFILGFFQEEMHQFRVHAPHIRWHDATGSDHDLEWLPIMRTDVVLECPERSIVIDAKYYTDAFSHSRSKRTIRSAHLYQIFAYVKNRAASRPEQAQEGMLVYPVVEKAFSFDYHLDGHQISIRSINLDQPWRKIHEDMLALVA